MNTIQEIISKESPKIGVDQFVVSVVLNPDYYKGAGKKIRSVDMEHYNYMISLLHQSERFKYIPSTHKKGGKGRKPSANHHYLMHGGRSILHVMTGCQYGNPFIKLGINLSKTTEDDHKVIRNELASITPIWADKKALLHLMEVSLMELFIDLPNVTTDEIMIISPASHSHSVVHDSTEYYGKRSSKISITKYDKAKELHETEGIALGHELTRIEVRVREKRLSVGDILEMGEVNFYDKLFHNAH